MKTEEQDNQQEPLVICVGKGGKQDVAENLAKRIGAELTEEAGKGLTLLFDANGVSLNGYGMSYCGDFEKMLYRLTQGRLQHEMIAKLAKTKEPHPTAIDATAGMGEDSILFAAAGYEVTMYEQNPVIAALLRDAMQRARKHPVLGEIIQRMHLIEGNSVELMKEQPDAPDIIYLDPMFPARQKSGLINKKLQLIQKLEHPCVEEEELLSAALSLHPKKIIIKRPLKGAKLAGKEPSYTIQGKAIRYDCIVG